MFDAIDAARDHVHLETCILDDDTIGERLTEKLLARRRLGVEVRVTYDAIGSIGISEEFTGRLRRGGVLIKPFALDPVAADLNVRDHRKLLIVDGRTGFIGGINVSDDDSSSSFGTRTVSASESPEQQTNWRDTHLRVDGPVVRALQDLFLRTWQSLPGNEPAPDRPYPALQSVGTALVRPVASTGGDDEHAIHATYLSAIRHARERVWLTHAYFSPDSTLLEALPARARSIGSSFRRAPAAGAGAVSPEKIL